MMYDDPLKPKTAKQGVLDALGGDLAGPAVPTPLQPGVEPNAIQPMEPTEPPPTLATTPRNDTRLMEGDAGKLANVDHAKKSPKYDFLQLANQGKYGYDQLGDMLGELQKGPNASHWEGWTADKDKLRYGGDPSKLGSQWGGVTTVDTIGGFNSGSPQGFRWGADDAGTHGPQPQGGQPSPFNMSSSMLASPLQAGRGSDNVQSALGAMGGEATDSSLLQKLIAQLGGA